MNFILRHVESEFQTGKAGIKEKRPTWGSAFLLSSFPPLLLCLFCYITMASHFTNTMLRASRPVLRSLLTSQRRTLMTRSLTLTQSPLTMAYQSTPLRRVAPLGFNQGKGRLERSTVHLLM
jgi:hypothetical protein